jgi:ligand-binding sensor domain-containing protein
MVERRKPTEYIPFSDNDPEYIPFSDNDPDKIVVSMVEFGGNLYVATQKGVYILNDGTFDRVEIKNYEDKT